MIFHTPVQLEEIDFSIFRTVWPFIRQTFTPRNDMRVEFFRSCDVKFTESVPHKGCRVFPIKFWIAVLNSLVNFLQRGKNL